ncbi:polyprenyl synthetase family protein [Allomeiothermus silvanus]|uniref:polyprenyl synthetase family protein n=1 Tax=Allomeiothermus silvanus TaxID=52022 RepID=UPI0023F2A3E9|nr:polyprenyl synthetase family protein [Allomeiothermus silvanus]
MSVKVVTSDLEPLLTTFEEYLRELVRSDVEFIRLIEDDLVTAGGKRVRPQLAFLASRALGGVPYEMELALAVELLHSTTLLHDDLVDDAETRRGHVAAFRKYGNAVSVLAGDYLLSRLLYLLSITGRMELVYMFSEVARELAESEVLQFQIAALGDYSFEAYERIITGKTASLMRLACEGAAVLGNAPSEWRGALSSFGLLYGQAFQMRDDYLDLMGTPESLGKPIGGDVREGKLTAITLRLLDIYPQETLEIIHRRGAHPEDIETLRKLALASGAHQEVVQAILERVDQAIAALSVLPPSPSREALEALAKREASRLT